MTNVRRDFTFHSYESGHFQQPRPVVRILLKCLAFWRGSCDPRGTDQIKGVLLYTRTRRHRPEAAVTQRSCEAMAQRQRGLRQ